MRSSLLSSLGVRFNGVRVTLILELLLLALPALLVAQENLPPGAPGEIGISEVTAHSARIAWGAAVDPEGDALVYLVSLRKRLEGVAQPWSPPRETRATFLVWDGLSASTVYEVKVVAWDGHAAGPARIRERAFVTLSDVEGNHPPTTPRGIEAADVGAHRVRLVWGASTDADNDPITYMVSLRKRAEGATFEWLPAVTTSGTSILWDGLEAETLYDARVRASDGKSVSRWFLREGAFRTTPELNAPTRPGEISVSGVTSTTAVIAWGAASGPAGVRLVYQVQVRSRLEGVAQPWRQVAETAELSLSVTGLLPGTVYDVEVRAWAQGVAGAWAIRERAFVTLRGSEVNHAPTTPGPVEVTELTPFSVRLSWGPSTDADGDRITYAVSLRKRVEGVAQPWSRARETERPIIAWDGLSPETIYEVRIRAWDGRVASDWYLKENAFVTPSASRLGSFLQRADPTQPNDLPSLIIVWPDTAESQTFESSDTVGSWIQCLEVETDGTQNRARVPMDTNARFFRVR